MPTRVAALLLHPFTAWTITLRLSLIARTANLEKLFDPQLVIIFALLKLPIFRLALAWKQHPPRTVTSPVTKNPRAEAIFI
jgi:hypothetical protein